MKRSIEEIPTVRGVAKVKRWGRLPALVRQDWAHQHHAKQTQRVENPSREFALVKRTR